MNNNLTNENKNNIDNFYEKMGIDRKEWLYGWLCNNFYKIRYKRFW
jgi:hypothetical protein